MNLKGKVAVITGGASGIGRATCLQLAAEDVKAIAVVDITDLKSFSFVASQKSDWK